MYSLSIKSSIQNYDVLFCESFYLELKKELKQGDIIIIDQNLLSFLPDDIQNIIDINDHIVIEASEDQKSYIAITSIIEQLIDRRFRKNNRLIAIGGGITQDITAFISSIIYRGVGWVFFPTTLLAQADSCIGGKTSINIGKYKNQLGNFYPPKKIYIIPEFIKTLPKLDFKSGMGEMLHFYLVSGEGDFSLYQKHYENAFQDEKALLTLVKRNLEIKKGFIERDEFDRGERQLLNYGHSFGHAIESLVNYSIPHGIAVSYGMDLANYISVKLGFIDNSNRQRMLVQLEKIWDGTSIKNLSVSDFENALAKDKKNKGNTYQLILTKGVGEMVKYGITPNKMFTNWLKEYFNSIKA
jgi:3-dehydroquinate synthase